MASLNAEAQAKVRALEAEARAFEAEARFHDLQSDRLERALEEEQAALESQRVLDFTSDISFASARAAINTLSEWRARSKDPITIRLMSPGGNVIATLALYDYIRLLVAEGIDVTVVGIGFCASGGAVLLQAGNRRVVTSNTHVMIHEISTEAVGRLSDIADEAKFLERMQDRLLDILSEKSTFTKRQIKNRWKGKDWWLNAEEAVEAGFADEIAETL